MFLYQLTSVCLLSKADKIMNKRFYQLFFILLIIFAFMQKIISQTATLGNIIAGQGEYVLIPVNFYDMTNLGAITIYVEFDTTVLTYTGITNVVSEGSGTISYYDPENARVGLSWIAPGMSGIDFPDGKYLDFQFLFLGDYSDLIFSSDCEIATFQGVVLEVTYENGSISVPLVTFSLNVFLEGAYQSGSGGLMETDLFDSGSMPDNQPYSPVLPYFGNYSPTWYYAGTENTVTIPTEVVDWVLVELRDAANVEDATVTTIVAQKACFLLSSGSIVDIDGNIPTFYTSFNNGAFVVLWHRNHLGIMSSGKVPGFGNVYYYDFTIGPGTVAGGSAGYVELESDIWGMAAGDIDADRVIDEQDKVLGWEINAASKGYSGADVNLDVQVNNPDKNELILKNIGKISGVPD